MDIKELTEKFIEAEKQAFSQGIFQALEQIESPDIIVHLPPAPDFIGFEAHKQYIENVFQTTRDLQQEWEYVTGDGNIAVVSLKERVTLTVDNPVFKIPAGTTMNVDTFLILRREKERIAEIWIKGSSTFEQGLKY